jgi:predicted permease
MIISDSLSQRLFGETANAVGAELVFEGRPVTVIGVVPAGLQLAWDPDVFTLIGQNTRGFMQNRGVHPGINVFARLRPTATIEEAREELSLIGRNLAEQYPNSNEGRGFIADPLRPDVGTAGQTLWLLLGAVSLVLLIACANVASLLLARAVSREREFAIRTALGAGRSRLVRQCLTESTVLAVLGSGFGVFLAWLGVRPFVLFWPGSLPRASEAELDWQVLLFALGVSLLSGLIFGLAPALRAPARDLEKALRAGGRSVTGGSRRLHNAFVVSEIALAVVLLVSAGMLARTLLHLSSLDPGLNPENVLATRMALSPATLASPAQIRIAWQEVLDRARAVPGVQSIATVDTVPLREGNNQLGYWPTPDLPPENEQPFALASSVSPDYLDVMGIPLRAGRFFDERDRIGTQPVVVIDDVLARDAFGGEDPIGKRLWVPRMGRDPMLIVGVVGHVRYWGAATDDQHRVRAQLYYPFAQVQDELLRRWSELMSIAVRTNVDPVTVLEPLRRAVRGAAGDQVLYEVWTLDQLAANQLAQQRFLLLLFGIFAGLAMLLACIGIYGVLAYLTSQRVPEIGVRIALGATANDVVRLVLRQSLVMIVVGVVIGSIAALAGGRVMLRMVEGMTPTEPLTFALTILVLVAAALFASYVPARRASRIDPIAALRQE